MFVFARGCIHQGLDPECFSDEFRGRCEIFMCFAAPFDNSLIVGGTKTSDQILLHGYSFFSVHSTEVMCQAKIILFCSE